MGGDTRRPGQAGLMGKCSECKRPKAAWVKKVRRLADELLACENKSDDRAEVGLQHGLNQAGHRLDQLLKEIEQ